MTPGEPSICSTDHPQNPVEHGENLSAEAVENDAHLSEDLDYDRRIVSSLRKIIRTLDIQSRKLASLHSITGPQLACLGAIIDQGPLTATEIARQVHLSASTVVGILDRLEEKGMIVRERDSDDRRLVFVSATSTGKDTLDQAPAPLRNSLGEALKYLPSIDQSALACALERLAECIGPDGAKLTETDTDQVDATAQN